MSIPRRVWRVTLLRLDDLHSTFLRSLLLTRLVARRLFPKQMNTFPDILAVDVPVIVINLSKRQDRLRDVTSNLGQVGFKDVRLLKAIDGPEKYPDILRGHAANLGCTESHFAAVAANLQVGQPVAICEDDNEFLEEPDKIRELIEKFLMTPHFDVLCLSARARGPKLLVSPEFHLVSWAMAPAFYVLKPRAKKHVLSAYRTSIRRLKAQRRRGPFDQVWRTTQRFSLLFVRPIMRVARQKESYSDIQDKYFAGT